MGEDNKTFIDYINENEIVVTTTLINLDDCEISSEAYGMMTLGCYLDVMNNKLINSFNGLFDGLGNIINNIANDFIQLEKGLISDIWNGITEGIGDLLYDWFGIDDGALRTLQRYGWGLISLLYGFIAFILTLIIGLMLLLAIIFECLIIIASFGSKTRNAWQQLVYWCELHVMILYHSVNIAVKGLSWIIGIIVGIWGGAFNKL